MPDRPGGRNQIADRVRNTVLPPTTKASLQLMPHVPDRVKRLLLGGRSVAVDGNTLDTTLQLLLVAQHAIGMDGLVASDDVAVARAEFDASAAMFRRHLPCDVDALTIPGPAGDLPARHYRPAGGAPGEAVLVYYHGGGWVLGSLDVYDSLCRLIAREAGIHVVSVDYRQPPENKAPAAADDAYAAYRWVLDHAADLGADARIAVGGDSAGGNLAAVVAQRCRADGGPAPVLQLLIYPVTKVGAETRSRNLFAEGYLLTKANMDWFEHHYVDGSSVARTDPVVSPLLAEDLSGLCPALVLTAGFDPLRDEGNEYAEAMRAAGVAVDLREHGSLIHGFANFFPIGGGGAAATAEMISALRAHLSRSRLR